MSVFDDVGNLIPDPLSGIKSFIFKLALLAGGVYLAAKVVA